MINKYDAYNFLLVFVSLFHNKRKSYNKSDLLLFIELNKFSLHKYDNLLFNIEIEFNGDECYSYQLDNAYNKLIRDGVIYFKDELVVINKYANYSCDKYYYNQMKNFVSEFILFEKKDIKKNNKFILSKKIRKNE